MKVFKTAVALLLSLAVLFSFAACGKKDKDENEDPTNKNDIVQADVQTQSLSEAGLSLNKILKANDIETLMKKYETVTVTERSSLGGETITQVFRFEDGIAMVRLEKSANGAELVTGEIKGYDFVAEKDSVKAYRDIESLGETATFGRNDIITGFFGDKELVSAGGSEGSYILKSLSEDKKTAAERYFFIDKESLELEKITYKNAVGNTEDVAVVFNGELESFAKSIADSFAGEMKTVKVVCEVKDGDAVSVETNKLQLPADWEYVPSGDGRIDYYMDKAMSKEYTYPGHGENYTLYISNIFDEVDEGKK